MPQSHDVTIDGAGYMLLPGSYRYKNLGADVAAVRSGVGTFGGRLALSSSSPAVVDRDAARWEAVGMMPSPVDIGIEAGRLVLAPAETSLNLALGINWDRNSQGIVYLGSVYITLGAFLYRVTVNGSGQMTGVVFVGTAAGTITSMAVANGLLLMACAAPAATMSSYAAGGAMANTPAVPAGFVFAYALGIWRTKLNAVNASYDKISGSFDGGATWADYELDSAVRAAIPWRGRATGGGVMLLATANRLWELAGVWSGSPAVFGGTPSVIYEGTGGGDVYDFTWLVEFQGSVYTWYAGTVHRWNGQTLTPMAGGPRGYTFGACAAGGYLVVSVVDPGGVLYALWAFDGVRWFILQRSASVIYNNPTGTAGIVTDGHVISQNFAAQTVSRWAMPVQGLTSAPRTSGQVIAGPLDAGQGDTIKTWTLFSVSWSTALYPSLATAAANPGGNLLFEYSIDDGSNWVTAGTTVVPAGGRSGLAAQTPAGGSVQAARLLLRITWTPTSAYAAFQIDSVYASGWKIGDVAKDERWTFALKLTDRLIKRDGSVDARSGETQLQALRALAQAGRTFTYQDLDFDLAARSVTARVLELEETERKGDGTHFLESQVKVTIAAVP